jgi:hypothetical protein
VPAVKPRRPRWKQARRRTFEPTPAETAIVALLTVATVAALGAVVGLIARGTAAAAVEGAGLVIFLSALSLLPVYARTRREQTHSATKR